MKKIFKNIVAIAALLFLGLTQSSFAMSRVYNEAREITLGDRIKPVVALVSFIVDIILIAAIILFFIINEIKNKKLKDPKVDNKEVEERVKNERKAMQVILYISGIVLSIILLLYLRLSNEISLQLFLIPIVIFVISLIVRLYKKKKLSNIIWIISIILICIFAICICINDRKIDKFNYQFWKYTGMYVDDEGNEHEAQEFDVTEFIYSVINDNDEDNKKVTIKYQNKKYYTMTELKSLLGNIDKSIKWKATNISYNNNGLDHAYISEIEIEPVSKEPFSFLFEQQNKQ